MGKIQKQKEAAAKVYSLPADYLRRQRYTEFLQKRSDGRTLICWYIGPETGRLLGVYCSEQMESPEVDAYNIGERGVLMFDDAKIRVGWNKLLDWLRIAPESCCTEFMGYFMGFGRLPGRKDCGKVIPFRHIA